RDVRAEPQASHFLPAARRVITIGVWPHERERRLRYAPTRRGKRRDHVELSFARLDTADEPDAHAGRRTSRRHRRIDAIDPDAPRDVDEPRLLHSAVEEHAFV